MKEINSVGKSKGSKLLRNSIIIVLVLIVILLVVFAILYFCTDLLKSNKELFFKYAAQLGETEDGFVEGNIESFNNKKLQTPYKNKGKFDFSVDLGDATNDQVDIANDFCINFSGKTDKPNQKAEQNIELDYSDDVNWPLIYRHDGDIYGIQTDYVSSKYVAIENTNLKDLAEKMGISDTSEIPNKIEIPEDTSSFEYTEEEMKTVKEKYLGTLNNQLRYDQFQSEKSDNGTIKYTLTMTNEELKNLAIALLNELKTDNITLGKINDLLAEQDLYTEKKSIDSDDIDSIIKDIQDEKTQEGQVQLIVTQKDSKLTSISINQNGSSIELNKTNQDNNVNYMLSININDDTALSSIGTVEWTMYFSANYSGLSELSNVGENYELGLEITNNENQEENVKYVYQYENNIEFVDSVNIEGFDDDNAMILNNYEAEPIQNFMGQLAQRITDVNTNQMQELGFNYGNPMLFMIPTIPLMINTMNLATQSINQSDVSEAELQAFNSQITKYQGEQRGTIIKSMIQEINSINASGDNQVEIEFNGIGTVTDEDASIYIQFFIDNENTYTVTIEYDDSGRANKVIVDGDFKGHVTY